MRRLEAHHIKPFAVLFRKFLDTYSQFNPVEHRKVLQERARFYIPFWDITNGKTLCRPCHDKTKDHTSRRGYAARNFK